MFAHVEHGTVADLHLANVHVVSSRGAASGLAAQNDSVLSNDSVGGIVRATNSNCSFAGGLAGTNNGTIRDSYATTSVEYGGGLVGVNEGSISASYATGTITGVGAGLAAENFGSIDSSFATGALLPGNEPGEIGGLVGQNGGAITNSYATGAVTCACQQQQELGGLVGYNFAGGQYPGTISSSYSTGEVMGRTESLVGGLSATM